MDQFPQERHGSHFFLLKGNAGLNTKLQSDMKKTNDFIKKTDISLAIKIVKSNSCVPFDMQWISLGIWAK